MSTPAPPTYIGSLKPLLAAFGVQPSLDLEGPAGISRAALIADLAAAPNAAPLLIVCRDDDEALRLRRDLGFFLGLTEEAPDFFGAPTDRLPAAGRYFALRSAQTGPR